MYCVLHEVVNVLELPTYLLMYSASILCWRAHASCCMKGSILCMKGCSTWNTDILSHVQGKRVVLPGTCIMLHHPSGAARGQASDLHNEARELMRLRNYVNNVLADATSQPLEKVSSLFSGILPSD